MKKSKTDSTNKKGRPKKGDSPRIAYEEIDRLLVYGEVVPTKDGQGTTVVYPSHRELGKRFGVSNSLISTYSKSHNCIRRRKTAQTRVTVEADKKLIELRSNAIAVTHDDQIRMIDSYLLNFEKAIAEGRMRFDNPSDFNTLCRLKEYLLGGADSRQEIHAALSLEDLQSRHRKMMKEIESSSAAERGISHEPPMKAIAPTSGSREASPPALSSKNDQEKMSDHFFDSANTRETGADGNDLDQQCLDTDPGQTEANVAPKGRGLGGTKKVGARGTNKGDTS